MTEAKDLYSQILAYFNIPLVEQVFYKHHNLMEKRKETFHFFFFRKKIFFFTKCFDSVKIKDTFLQHSISIWLNTQYLYFVHTNKYETLFLYSRNRTKTLF